MTKCRRLDGQCPHADRCISYDAPQPIVECQHPLDTGWFQRIVIYREAKEYARRLNPFKEANESREAQRACALERWEHRNDPPPKKRRPGRAPLTPPGAAPVVAQQIFDRDHGTCKACDLALSWDHRGRHTHNAPEIDHIMPVSQGGEHTCENVQLLCRRCNRIKGATVPLET